MVHKIAKLDHEAAMQAFSEFINDQSLKNGTPHSRYFSDELGVPIILIDTEQVFCLAKRCMV